MKALRLLFMSIFIMALITGCSSVEVANKSDSIGEVDSKYVGCWHSNPSVAAAFTDRYVFASDGTYRLILNQYDEKRVAYSQEGMWGVKDGKLVLSVIKQINLNKTIVELSDTYSYSIGNVEEESSDNSPYKYKVSIGGEEFWQYSNESNFLDQEYNEFINEIK